MSEIPTGERNENVAPKKRRESLRRMSSKVLDRLGLREADPERRTLRGSLKVFDEAIPNIVDAFDARGDRYSRPREFKPKDTYTNIVEAFAEHFPADQEELLEETNRLLVSLTPTDTHGDTSPLGKMDAFLAEYPTNVIDNLGNEASAEHIVAIFAAAEEVASHYENSFDATTFRAEIASLVGTFIPQLVAREGVECLADIKKIHETSKLTAIKDYIKARLEDQDESQSKNFNPEAMKDIPIPESPFSTNDEEAWRGGGWMGEESRRPEWGDLVAMMRVTMHQSGEYGLVVAESDSGEPSVGFIRGGRGAVSNKSLMKGDKKVFFHSHPSIQETLEGLCGPLVSEADIEGTLFNDHGGGYLNVVSEYGMTLHIGSSGIAIDAKETEYKVESGELANTYIRIPTEGKGVVPEVVEQLKLMEEPYVYSVTEPNAVDTIPNRHTFVHIPWSHLNREVDVSDLCFGKGLETILTSLPGDFDAPENLFNAIRQAKGYKLTH